MSDLQLALPLLAALGLSSVVGLERELSQASVGLRTLTSAASILGTASLGVICGLQHYLLAVIVALMATAGLK